MKQRYLKIFFRGCVLVWLLSTVTVGQPLPTGVTLTPFYDLNDVNMIADQVKTVGMWEVPGLPEHFFVLNQWGAIYSLYPDTTRTYAQGELKDYTKSTLADFQNKVNKNLRSEYGAYSIAFHPDFRQNRLFYVLYLALAPGQTNIGRRSGGIITVEEWSANSNVTAITLERVVFTFDHNPSYGTSSMNFGPDGYLYIAISDYAESGWDLTTLGRKMLRIDVDNQDPGLGYAIPSGNPYMNDANALDEIWASGLRNNWSFTFDYQNGDLWAGDVGQEVNEELNLILPGRNYGWADGGNSEPRNYGDGFSGNCAAAPGVSQFPGNSWNCSLYEDPYFVFPHANSNQSITNQCINVGVVFRGSSSSPFYGYLFVNDVLTGKIWAVRKGETPQLVGQVPGSISDNLDGHDGVVNWSSDYYGNMYVSIVSWYQDYPADPNSGTPMYHNIYRVDHAQLLPKIAGCMNLNSPDYDPNAELPGPCQVSGIVDPGFYANNKISPVFTNIQGASFKVPMGFKGVEFYNLNGQKVWAYAGGDGREHFVRVPDFVEKGLLKVRLLTL